MLVVAVVMILVVGPKDLPGMLRSIGKNVGNLKRMAGDFQRQFSDALRESEIDELKKDLTSSVDGIKSIANPLDDINASADKLLASIDADVDLDQDIVADVLGDKTTGTPVKKKPAKKTVKKSPVKKSVAKRPPAGTPKKAVSKKTTVRKTPAKKPTAKRKVSAGSKTA